MTTVLLGLTAIAAIVFVVLTSEMDDWRAGELLGCGGLLIAAAALGGLVVGCVA